MKRQIFGFFWVVATVTTSGSLNAQLIDNSGLGSLSKYRRFDMARMAVSFELPKSWVHEPKEGTLLFHSAEKVPSGGPEATLSLQMIDNTEGASSLQKQVETLRGNLTGLPGVEFLADEEDDFAGRPGHLLMGRFNGKDGVSRGMIWCVFSRGAYFYWLGMIFPPEKWSGDYGVVMDRVNTGFRFTALHQHAIEETSKVVTAFLHEIRSGKVDEAFARTSETFQNGTPRPAFGTFLTENASLNTFESFRVLENSGTANQRRLTIELTGVPGEGIPTAVIDLVRGDDGNFLVSLLYLVLGQRVGDLGEDTSLEGFSKLIAKNAGFTGFFPENWIVVPEDLPNGFRLALRRPGHGPERITEAITVTIGPGTVTAAEALKKYLGPFSGQPGFQGAPIQDSQHGGNPAAGIFFALDVEDDRGLRRTANMVTTIRSPKNVIAAVHIMMEFNAANGFEERLETLVRPVIENFQILE